MLIVKQIRPSGEISYYFASEITYRLDPFGDGDELSIGGPVNHNIDEGLAKVLSPDGVELDTFALGRLCGLSFRAETRRLDCDVPECFEDAVWVACLPGGLQMCLCAGHLSQATVKARLDHVTPKP